MSDGTGSTAYSALLAHLRETALYASAGSVLGWDQETMMPARGAELRSEQLAALSGLVHERHVGGPVAEWLAACETDPELLADPLAAANVRQIRRDHDRLVRLPGSLVREFAQTTALAQQAWRDARERSDFAGFAPWLQKVVTLSAAQGECLSEPGLDPYDALMDAYEAGARAADLERVFADLRSRLAPLIAEIGRSGTRPEAAVQRASIPIERQVAFNREVAREIGFDFAAGRLDVSTHPFCEGIGPGDTRLTTRYRVESFADALSSMLHEVGHGLYEQGLPKQAHFGQPLAEAASLGIHESQSRLWENLVGRSREFWEWALPRARDAFGSALDGMTPERVYGAVNVVEPNLIRVESDEATYNLHVMLRFDLERALLRGDLAIADLPGAWDERIESDLGLEVPDDRRGCLQDIHWSMGAIGYFPTYTLGNLYAAQLWDAASASIPDLADRMTRGDFAPLVGWLREAIHRHGRRFSATELCVRTTGSPLGAEPFLRYLQGKLAPLYGL